MTALMYPFGTIILCRNGHEVADVIGDIYADAPANPEAISFRDGHRPIKGERIKNECPQCGAPWAHWAATTGALSCIKVIFPDGVVKDVAP